jgi:hypothetical protein
MKIIAQGFLLVALMISSCASHLHTNVPLVWKPTNDVYSIISENLAPLYARKIKVDSFVDKRDTKEEIGKFIEDGANKPVTTSEDIAAWCTDRFKKVLTQYGVVPVENNADVILHGEVLHFYVTEDKTYRGNIGLKITALGSSGTVLWQGVTTGSAKRFGRSYSLENYYEVLSDSYSEAVNNLLKNTSFIQAFK